LFEKTNLADSFASIVSQSSTESPAAEEPTNNNNNDGLVFNNEPVFTPMPEEEPDIIEQIKEEKPVVVQEPKVEPVKQDELIAITKAAPKSKLAQRIRQQHFDDNKSGNDEEFSDVQL